MATQTIITRDTILKMISLLDWAYRLGVESAYETNDEGLCAEFLEKTAEPGVYGLLPDKYMSWKEWSLRLLSKARMTSWNGAMSRYIMLAGNFGATYLSCFYNVAQRYYNNGVEAYISAPNACDLSLFKSQTRLLWTSDGIKRINNRQFVDDIQLMCFELQRRDEEIWNTKTAYEAKKIALKPKQYDSFIRAVGLALAKKEN